MKTEVIPQFQSLPGTPAMLVLGMSMFQSRWDSLGDVKVSQGISARSYSEIEGTIPGEKECRVLSSFKFSAAS